MHDAFIVYTLLVTLASVFTVAIALIRMSLGLSFSDCG